MELIERLLFGSDSLWGGGAHSVMILALVMALGIMLGKIRIAGVSLIVAILIGLTGRITGSSSTRRCRPI